MKFADIVFNIPLNKTFQYAVPPSMENDLRPGQRVVAPFGSRVISGYCVGLSDRAEFAGVKELRGFDDRDVLFTDDLLRLSKWIADYYVCGQGEALEAMLPVSIRKNRVVKKVRYAELLVSAEEALKKVAELARRAKKQAQALEIIARAEVRMMPVEDLRKRYGVSSNILCALEKSGLIEFVERDFDYVRKIIEEPPATGTFTLTPEQELSLASIAASLRSETFAVHAIKGVTGSGKTEIYLRLIAEAVSRGKQAFVLVPEISLTPQTIERFRARFSHVAVLHSHQTPAERREEWMKVRHGAVDVVIGARSAVFAPAPNLGIIVIDEEHENSFKQESPAPRYHAREVAIMRAKWKNAVVVLGSATPSVETYYNALNKKFSLSILNRRVEDRPMPPVKVVDMRQEVADQKRHVIFSRALVAAGNACLARGEQMILFLNRRGYSTVVHCPNCGLTVKCAHCDISLTYHRSGEEMLCHHCDYRAKAPKKCPDCHSEHIRYMGFGTERVEEELIKVFPEKVFARMDSDSTRGRGSHAKILGAFRRGEIQILLGTQMIAKGLDFPNVTLVGIISADTVLDMPDFRSAERTFQLLTQVAGRAGRSEKGGKVIVQTSSPEQPAIVLASTYNYDRFAAMELQERRRYGYPPFKRLVRLLIEGPDVTKVQELSENTANWLNALHEPDLIVQGPTPAPIEMLKGSFRWQIILKLNSPAHVLGFFNKYRDLIKSHGKTTITVDVDAVSML